MPSPRHRRPALPETVRRTILGAANPRHLSEPQPGFFRLRMVRGGVHVPASIFAPCPMVWPNLPPEPNVSPDPCPFCRAGFGVPHTVACFRSGVEWPHDWCQPMPRDAMPPNWLLLAEINGETADPLFVWERGQRVSCAQYRHMVAVRLYAQTHAPHQPEANPRTRLDLRQQPSLF
jgi:hypothetical protein